MNEKLQKVPISFRKLPAALSSLYKLFQKSCKTLSEGFNEASNTFQTHSHVMHYLTNIKERHNAVETRPNTAKNQKPNHSTPS